MSGRSRRLPAGGRIDRNVAVPFMFDGRSYTGFAGDTLASALLANGTWLMGRSFKYHRPRSVLTAGSAEPNALVTVDHGEGDLEPNCRATMLPLTPGLNARSQNAWPSLDLDLGSVLSLGRGMLGAGFYYKTFMWPRSAWRRLYEPVIRRLASHASVPARPARNRSAGRYAHCDVLVVGAGPAGLAAAEAAADQGADVILCDEQAELGGSLLSDATSTVDGQPAWEWIEARGAALAAFRGVRVLTRTTAFGHYRHNLVGLLQCWEGARGAGGTAVSQRLWQVRARSVVLATGAHERSLLFENNDLPGIMLASAARSYVERHGVAIGRRIVVLARHDSAWLDAVAIQRRTGAVACVVDMHDRAPDELDDLARRHDIETITGYRAVRALGRRHVRGVELSNGRHTRRLPCDVLLMAGGWTPAVHLHSQAGGRLAWRQDIGAFVAGSDLESVFTAGACRGTFETGECVADGRATGRQAATGTPGVLASAPPRGVPRSPNRSADAKPVGPAGRTFIDFQNDVTLDDLRLGLREGFRSIEHLKRYTTTGMATDQGKNSNINALVFVAGELGRLPDDVGTTTFRPPYTPVPFGALAAMAETGGISPRRHTPIHEWAAARSAVFENVALWQRARYFPQPGEDMDAAVRRECAATRSGVGIFDASTLGKIEVVGPDAAQFLENMYVNTWTTLAPGRCRYGLLLREDGFIFDDGVIGRLAADRFHVTTTTGGAAAVLQHLEDYQQTEFPDLRVWLTSTTEHWAVIALNGPAARSVLEPLVSGIDLSPDAFPHMAVRQGLICGVPTRLFRVSFTGELGFEINVPASRALTVWEALLAAGRTSGITPYGTETMHVLRAEKGYIIVGQETDGTVTPHDAGLAWTIGQSKRDFVGKRSLAHPALQRPDRRHLVGLLTTDGRTSLTEGAQVLAAPRGTPAPRVLGHVTSAYGHSVIDRPIALALVESGRQRMEQAVWITREPGGTTIEARITSPVFHDPDGVRLRG